MKEINKWLHCLLEEKIMINTLCSGCLFENYDNKQCFFDIPEIINSHKNIKENNGSLYIEDYACRYCISKNIYNENEQFRNIDILQFVVDQAKLNYYLVVNMSHYQNDPNKICNIINNLDIKPKYISFINKNLKEGQALSEKIKSNIDTNLGWKLHNFIVDLSLQDCSTISMDTNIGKVDGGIFTIYDPSEEDAENTDLLNSRINFIHMECVVKQTRFHAVLSEKNKLDGLSISFPLYKNLMLNTNPDILKAISEDKEIVSIYYNYE